LKALGPVGLGEETALAGRGISRSLERFSPDLNRGDSLRGLAE
jgi:hypothetical protein